MSKSKSKSQQISFYPLWKVIMESLFPKGIWLFHETSNTDGARIDTKHSGSYNKLFMHLQCMCKQTLLRVHVWSVSVVANWDEQTGQLYQARDIG